MSSDEVSGRQNAPDPVSGAHSALPDLLAAFKRPTCKEKKRREKRQKENEGTQRKCRREGNVKGGEGKKGGPE